MSEKSVKVKLINSSETCVDDNLRGVVAMYPRMHLHPKHRVITTQMKTESKRVAILGGGGSGHEPFAAGYIGAGMMDGVVAGAVFAAPPTANVLYAITQLSRFHSGGVLVVIGNYTGDRLTFGKAIEKAKVAGVKVEGLIVGEDIASSGNKAGGRSMCGEVFFYKLCGAMSAEGYNLGEIKKIAKEANKRMATQGVCLGACSLPGQPPLFSTNPGEMELGAGVHGEAGVCKMAVRTAQETVEMMVQQIVDHLKIPAGARVAVMVNNLGGTSVMEMNIISAETKNSFERRLIKLERLYSGPYKTSLEMHAVQICAIHLDSEYGDLLLKLLDASTDAPAWVGSNMLKGTGENNIGDVEMESLVKTDSKGLPPGPFLTTHTEAILKSGILSAATALVREEELLNRLDSGCGDGDCGTTMRRFAQAIIQHLETKSVHSLVLALSKLSELAETDMGGTSGGLYGLGLAAASVSFAKSRLLTVDRCCSALESAIQVISTYGGAEPGDRTMLDTLDATAKALRQYGEGDLKTCLLKTAEAAKQGAKGTANMVARAGRASYVSDQYTREADAGAMAAHIWLSQLLTHLAERFNESIFIQ